MAVVVRAATIVMATSTLLLLVVAARALVHKTIESEDGDVIDCVDISHESHQVRPERSMEEIITGSATGTVLAEKRHQTWRKGGDCPDGSAPVRRHTGNATAMEITRRLSSSAKFEIAAAYATWGPYHGLRANLPYFRVNVHPDEFSMTYVMIGYTLDPKYRGGKGADPPNTLENQIMAGLVTWPALYNDSRPRLFVYYSNDGGVQHKCFNLECGGFVVTSKEYSLGTAWHNSDSQIGGRTYGIPIGIHRDAAKMIWWVSVNDVDIGYYRQTLFNTRFPEGSYIEIGGRVLDTRPGGNHTSTPMGNMMPVCAGSHFAATIREYLSIGANGQLFKDPISRTVTTTPACYDVKPLGFSRGRPGYLVVYGGPGGGYCDKR